MKRYRSIFGRFSVAWSCSAVAALLFYSAASDLKAESRDWTSIAGTTITATMQSSRGDSVVLKTAAGKTMTVKLNQLSQADRDYVTAAVAAMKPASGDDDAADSDDNGKGGTVLSEKWYEDRPGVVRDDEVVVQNFSLDAGESRRFDVTGLQGDYPMISFTVDIGSELHEMYGKDHRIKVEQVGKTDKVASNIGGGMGFEQKGGKVKLKLSNDSEKTVKVVVKVKRDGLKDADK